VELSGQRRGAGRALRGERGQTSAEYLGIILVVVAILAAISSADIGAAISVEVERAVCQIAADGDGGVECKGADAATEERSGARARPAPNLYDAEATPRLAGLNARSPKFVATGASARATEGPAESTDATGSAQSRGATGSAGLPSALLTSPVLTPPVTSEGRDALRGFVKEWSGLGDAERAFEALAEGRYGEALVPGILALPWSKALKVGTKIVEKGAEKLGPQAKKLWRRLGRASPATRPPRAGSTPIRPITGGNRRIQALRNIGEQGGGRSVREVPGGLERATDIYSGLARGARPYRTLPDGRQLLQRTDGTIIGLRSRSASGPPSIDVRPPGSKDLYFQLKFTGSR
jgi:hypothetical protein